MRELKSYIFEGFFNNVGANNIIKPVIDAIKDASLNDKIDSRSKKIKFYDLLTSILEDVETNMKKGKFVFEYIRNNTKFKTYKNIISLEITELNEAKWTFKWTYDDNKSGELAIGTSTIAYNIAEDLYNEVMYPVDEPDLHHSIANTIKVIEFKVS